MGRQTLFHALPDDLGEFFQFVSTEGPVVVTVMDSDRAEIELLANPRCESRVMTLWNQALIPTLERELVRRHPGSDYYRIPYSLPVLELSPSRATSWNEQPALLRGRLYGFSFEGVSKEYATWYAALARWIRAHFAKGPVEGLNGYVGRAALAWFHQGGIPPAHVAPTSHPGVGIVCRGSKDGTREAELIDKKVFIRRARDVVDRVVGEECTPGKVRPMGSRRPLEEVFDGSGRISICRDRRGH